MAKLKVTLILSLLFVGALFAQNRTYRYPDQILPISCPQNQSATVTVTTTARIVPAPRSISSTDYTTGLATFTQGSAVVTGKAGTTLWLTGTNRPRVGSIIRNTSIDTDILGNWYYIIAIATEESLTIDRNYAPATVNEGTYLAATPSRVCSYIVHNPDTADDVFFKGIDGGNIGNYSSTGASNLNSDLCPFGFDVTRASPITGVLLWTAGTTAEITVTFKGRDYATP